MPSTKVELIAELLQKPQSVQRDRIIERASQGVYHDFETQLATPKVVLICALRDAGFDDLAEKTKQGAYDEHPSAEDIEKLAAGLSTKDRALFERLLSMPDSALEDMLKRKRGRA
jgi:hypothetical protein